MQSTQQNTRVGADMETFAALQRTTIARKLVMIIDDSATVRKIVETSLGREGYDVVSFSDGVEAMRWLTQPDSRLPQMIILDIVLPKMDGYEVARRLKSKAQFNDTAIIMLTRRDGILDRLKGRLAGAKEYLIKPLKTQELIAAVEMHLGTPSYKEGNRPD